MVTITVDKITAQIEVGVWTSTDPILLSQCEFFTVLHPWNAEPSNPDPDYDVAQYVAKKLEGRITQADKPEFSDLLVY